MVICPRLHGSWRAELGLHPGTFSSWDYARRTRGPHGHCQGPRSPIQGQGAGGSGWQVWGGAEADFKLVPPSSGRVILACPPSWLRTTWKDRAPAPSQPLSLWRLLPGRVVSPGGEEGSEGVGSSVPGALPAASGEVQGWQAGGEVGCGPRGTQPPRLPWPREQSWTARGQDWPCASPESHRVISLTSSTLAMTVSSAVGLWGWQLTSLQLTGPKGAEVWTRGRI